QHGLAPLLGSTTDVGAVGYTLGGGMGWLARRYGLGSDSVRSFQLVTPDGELVNASSDEHAELFWALKGGGAGTLGVVTSMEIDLYPVGAVYAGNLLYPVEMAAEVVARWRDWVVGMDERMTSSVVIMNFPPMDVVPEPIRGQSFVIVRGCWCGDLADGEAMINGWRSWRAPALDMFGPMPFAMADTISNDPVDPLPGIATSEWFDSIPTQVIDTLVNATVPQPGRMPLILMTEIRHAGGAVRSKAVNAANDAGRSGEFLLEMVGLALTPEIGAAVHSLFQSARAEMAPYVTGATYLNFTEGAERQQRTNSAFSAENLRRLQAVKDAVDSADRYCHGFGLTPR
ncbi:MAG: mcrA 1, partial [Ilumatobacteraceae bacterium]|nr:mcrA 1 [Ilumatobacteraceae bacterium]